MPDTIIPVQSEYEKLLEEVKKLRARLIELTAQRDDLLYHICPALQAKYDENIGSIERELLAAQMYLKEKQRIPIYLFYYEDRSIQDIARVLRLPENTVKSRLRRGRMELKTILQEDWRDDEP